MKRIFTKLLSVVLSIGLTLPCSIVFAQGVEQKNLDGTAVVVNNKTSFSQYLEENKDALHPLEEIIIPAGSYKNTGDLTLKTIPVLDGKKDVLTTTDKSVVEWDFDVKSEGLYNIEVTYYPLEGKGGQIERSMQINGKTPYIDFASIAFQRVYKNDGEYQTDYNGNHLRPNQIEAPSFRTQVLTPSDHNANANLAVKLNSGKNTIKLTSVKEPLAIASIRFFNSEAAPSYDSVKKGYKQGEEVETIFLQGENASFKSDTSLFPISDRSSAMNNPLSIDKIVINAVGGRNWSKPKQWIKWDFDVKKPGIYKIHIRGKQDFNAGMTSYRKILIDGKLPFDEANSLAFPYNSEWQVYELSKNDTMLTFYLDSGEHSITLENSIGDVSPILNRLNDVIVELNKCYKQVFMITGSYPDPDRDYHIEVALPELKENFADIAKKLDSIKKDYLDITGTKGTGYASIEKLAVQLDSFVENIEKMPARLDTFRTNISGLSDFALMATDQPLLVDWIKLVPTDSKPEKADQGFFGKMMFGIKSFFISFIVDYNSISGDKNSDYKTIDLWIGNDATQIGTGRDQAQSLQAIVENHFSTQHKIGVNIRLVDVSVLLPAVSSGKGPDIAIGLAPTYPMNFAYRGAVQKLSDFPDFEEVIKRFHPSSLTQFKYLDDYYALPDKYSFYMMFYRTDILSELNIDVPKTWDDIYKAIPVLENKYMQIGVPNIDENNIDLFTTLLFQNNGDVYDKDLSGSILDKPEGIKAFEDWTNFYTKYKVEKKINHLTRFRTGESPIVFMPYTFYTNLQAAAPEIKGQWSFDSLPGTMGADGKVNNTVSSTANGSLIFSNSEKKKESWEFLKWWTTAEVQSQFGREIENMQGPAGRYPTATVEALSLLPWSTKELEKITAQLENTRSVPEAPGSYMTPRYIITAASLTINNGLVPRDLIIDYNKMINNEVVSMRNKFGL